MPVIPINELDTSIEKAQQYMRAEQLPDGAWHGNCLAGPDATSEILIALRFLGVLDPSDASKARAWLLTQQRPDGSFSAYEGGGGSIDETCICYAALLHAEAYATEPAAENAYGYIQAHGGFAASTPYTKVLLSVAGILAPGALPDMPVEPLLIPGIERIIGSRFTPAYTIMSMLLPAIVNALKARVDPPDALRKASHSIANQNVIRYLTEHQNPTGNLFGVVNMTVMMLIAFKLLGLPPSDERFQRALADLKQWRIETGDKLTYTLYNSKVWNTALIVGILRDGKIDSHDSALVNAAKFLLSEQSLLELPRDWQNPGWSSPRTGGWPFEDRNPLAADSDSTSVVLWGLTSLQPRAPELQAAIDKGLAWLWGMQNDDGGWSGFSHGQASKPAGSFSIAAVDLPSDPIGALKLMLHVPPQFGEPALEDVTGRVLQALGPLGFRVSDARVARAVSFLHSQIDTNGVWWGRWETNYLPGTSEVLAGLAAVGADLKDPVVVNAIDWIKRHQNADGGFGETTASYDNLALAGTGEPSSYVTGIVANALIQCGEAASPAVEAAIRWCLNTQEPGGAWPQGSYQFTVQWPWPFYQLTLTPAIYPLRALTAYRKALAG